MSHQRQQAKPELRKTGAMPFLLLLVFAILPQGSAQEDRKSQQQNDPIPRFESRVRTVLVDTLVLDKDGSPVLDLSVEDFKVFEDGREQKIESFDVTDWTSYIEARTERAQAPSADEARLNAYPRRFIFVVNRRGATFEHLTRAKRALRKFVIDSVADGDESMVVEIGYSVKVLQEFAATKEDTLEGLKKLSAMRVDYPLGFDRSSRENYRALRDLGLALSNLPGRKVVVFFSTELQAGTAPGSRLSSEVASLTRAIEALNQSNTSLYSIDIRGIDSFGSRFNGGLSALAIDTGGRFFQNQTSFERPLARIGKENQRYYLLGYSPSNTEMDETFRKIEVRVDRPGVEVIARRGYVARESDTRLSTEAIETEPLDPPTKQAGGSRADGPVRPSAVEMTTYLLPTGTEKVRVPIAVALPPELLTQDGGNKRLQVEVTDDAGHSVAHFDEPVDLEHFYLLRNLDLKPGLYLLQITLSSPSAELYQASTGFDVPKDYGVRFGISSIVPVISPENSSDIGDLLPLLPTPAVHRGENAHILFQIFAGKRQPLRQVRLTYTIFKDQRQLHAIEHPRTIELLTSRADGTPVILSLPTGSLTPGVYRVELEVLDDEHSRRATSETEIRIE